MGYQDSKRVDEMLYYRETVLEISTDGISCHTFRQQHSITL